MPFCLEDLYYVDLFAFGLVLDFAEDFSDCWVDLARDCYLAWHFVFY